MTRAPGPCAADGWRDPAFGEGSCQLATLLYLLAVLWTVVTTGETPEPAYACPDPTPSAHQPITSHETNARGRDSGSNSCLDSHKYIL